MHHLVQTDRALGSLASVSSGTIAYGIRMTNTNPYATIHSLTVTYTGEQWRAANTRLDGPHRAQFHIADFNDGWRPEWQ